MSTSVKNVSFVSSVSANSFGTFVSSVECGEADRVVSQQELKSVLENDDLVVVPLQVVSTGNSVRIVCLQAFDQNTNGAVYISREEAKTSVGAKRLGKHILTNVVNRLKSRADSLAVAYTSPSSSNVSLDQDARL